MAECIIIRRELLDDITAHCREVYPNEACGILAGRGSEIEKAYRITNVRNSTVTYEMDPHEQFRCEKEIAKQGLTICCIYHSHPSSKAYPSQTDIERAYWPDDEDALIYPQAAYMIIGPIDGETETRVFKIRQKQTVDEINLNIIQ